MTITDRDTEPYAKTEMVVVRRKDLELALKCHDYGSVSWDAVGLRIEPLDRLKVALGRKEKSDEMS